MDVYSLCGKWNEVAGLAISRLQWAAWGIVQRGVLWPMIIWMWHSDYVDLCSVNWLTMWLSTNLHMCACSVLVT